MLWTSANRMKRSWETKWQPSSTGRLKRSPQTKRSLMPRMLRYLLLMLQSKSWRRHRSSSMQYWIILIRQSRLLWRLVTPPWPKHMPTSQRTRSWGRSCGWRLRSICSTIRARKRRWTQGWVHKEVSLVLKHLRLYPSQSMQIKKSTALLKLSRFSIQRNQSSRSTICSHFFHLVKKFKIWRSIFAIA